MLGTPAEVQLWSHSGEVEISMAGPCICSFNCWFSFIDFKLIFIAFIDVQGGSPLESLTAFNYDPNYKMSLISREHERINREMRQLKNRKLFCVIGYFYPWFPPFLPLNLLLLFLLLGKIITVLKNKCSSSTCDYQMICIFKS